MLYLQKILLSKETVHWVQGIYRAILFLISACKSTINYYAHWPSGISPRNAIFNIWKSFNIIHHVYHVSRIVSPNNIHVLIPGTCKYIKLCGKREFRLQVESHLLIIWPWDKETTLVSLRGPKVITWVHIVREGNKRANVTVM